MTDSAAANQQPDTSGKELRDEAQRDREEEVLRARIRLSQLAESHSEEQLLRATLDEAERLTGSTIGFLHYVDDDQETVFLQMWSSNTIARMCSAEGKGTHYPISQAGVWVDCVRLKQPVIHNDYASLPHRKGLPPGHAPVLRELVVPVIVEDRIVAILGVGNKATDYLPEDVRTVSILAQLVWDIIRRKRAEEELQAANQQLRTLFDNVHDAVFLHDPDGRLLDVNRSMTSLYQVSRDEALGLSLLEDFSAPGASAEQASRYWRQALAGEAVIFEWKARRPRDGYIFDIEVSLKSVVLNGAPAILANVRDITEHKRALESERQSRELLHAILDAIPVRVFWKDCDLRYLGCNMPFARDAGCSRPSEVVGRDDFAFGWRDQAESYQADDRAVISSGAARLLYEETQTTPQGDTIHLLTSKLPLRDPDGRITGVLGTYLDVTHLKQMEEERETLRQQLLQAQKLESIGRLAGGVAHDFNNMLGVIIGYVQMALGEEQLPEDLRHNFVEIQTAAQRATDIARQLLAFARKQVVNPRVLDLNSSVASTLKMLRRLIGEDIELRWLPASDLWPVRIDPVQLDQVLANLAVNARDAIGGVGRITVTTANVILKGDKGRQWEDCPPGDYVRLTLADTGAGMDQETLRRLFEPFFTTKELGKGTGLGLATVYGIVKQNSGCISVSSLPGQGTTFSICLPRVISPAEDMAGEAATEGPPRGNGELLLLVEDEDAIRAMSREMLESLGYRVLTAATGRQALTLISAHADEVSLVLSDVIMPEMNGRELADQLEVLRPGLKVLFMSGYTADIIARRGMLQNDVRFIQKPFKMHTLAVHVRQALTGGCPPA